MISPATAAAADPGIVFDGLGAGRDGLQHFYEARALGRREGFKQRTLGTVRGAACGA
jgi:hypothetical protein